MEPTNPDSGKGSSVIFQPGQEVLPVSEIETPALLIDGAAFQHNLRAAAAMFERAGKWLRPHFKTHGIPSLALRQLGKTTNGLTCATVDEAEALVAVGVGSVLIANEIVTRGKVERLASLAEKAQIIAVVDALEPLRLFSSVASERNVVMDVLIDVDTGLGRCGVKSSQEAVTLAREVADAPGVRFAGIMGYEGRLRATMPDRARYATYAFERLAEVKNALESAGLAVGIVSSSGTSTLREALQSPCVTEVQAGTYAFMEPDILDLGLPFRCALSVMTTVISTSPGQIVVDAGRRVIGCCYGPPLPISSEAEVLRVTDDHTMLRWNGALPPLGSRQPLRPSSNRTTFRLNREAWLVGEDGMAEHVSALPAAPPP